MATSPDRVTGSGMGQPELTDLPAELDIGCGPNKQDPDALGLDIRDYEPVDVVCDIEAGLPLPDETFRVVYLYSILEHVEDPADLLNEIHRVCIDGAMVYGKTPHHKDRNAWVDPTHVRPFDEQVFDFWDSTTELGRRGYYPDTEYRVHKSRRIRRVKFWKSRPIEFELEVIK